MYSRKAKVGKSTLELVHRTLKTVLRVKEKYLKTANEEVYYLHHEVKNAPTLVLIHGFSDIPESFLPCLFALRNKFNIILPALKGFDFEGVDPQKTYSLEIYRDTILGILDHHGIDEFHIGGNSLGGATSLLTYKGAPKRVKSLILINSAGFEFDHIDSVTKRFLKGENPFIVNARPDFKALTETIFHKVPRYPLFINQFLYEDYKISAQQYTDIATKLFETDKTLSQGSHIISPEEILVPTQIIWGESDGFFPLEIARTISDVIPDVRLRTIKNSGHVPHLESPNIVQNVIADFLKTQHE